MRISFSLMLTLSQSTPAGQGCMVLSAIPHTDAVAVMVARATSRIFPIVLTVMQSIIPSSTQVPKHFEEPRKPLGMSVSGDVPL